MKVKKIVKVKTMVSLAATMVFAGAVVSCTSKDSMKSENEEYKVIRIATFNASMEVNNYMGLKDGAQNDAATAEVLIQELARGSNQQIRHVAEIIQRVQPDILLLNEFDYIENPKQGIDAFINNYLSVPQNNQPPANFPYRFTAPVNTGTHTPLYSHQESRLRTYGFGYFPGQYGMAFLSKFPIDTNQVRTFQKFLWKDMPGHLIPKELANQSQSNKYWYSDAEVEVMRLSSKSHWDLPIKICGKPIHILASHPTPPVFDGPEDRNGRRNHDELRFWADYINGNSNSYHYDDSGKVGSLDKNSRFVILGDMNASEVEGDAYPNAVGQLLNHPLVNKYAAPLSLGGRENKPESQYSATHTAEWGMRADYVLPSANIEIVDSGVFWPDSMSQQRYLVADRSASSDHRLVWVDIKIPTGYCDL